MLIERDDQATWELRDYQVTKSRHEEFYQIGFFHKSSTGGSHVWSASDEEGTVAEVSLTEREELADRYVGIWKEEGQHMIVFR
jgi:hypothetical protein